jgi:hypothetical protein
MVRLFSILVLMLALSAPAYAAPPLSPAASPDEVAINRLLDDFNAAAARADGPAYFGAFTPNGVFVGTDASERWTLPQFRAFAEPYFAQGKGWTYTPTSRTITFADLPCLCVAWFEENLDSASYGTTRGTGMVVKGPDGWKIGQYVLTIPIPNDIAKDVVADIKAFEARPKPAS